MERLINITDPLLAHGNKNSLIYLVRPEEGGEDSGEDPLGGDGDNEPEEEPEGDEDGEV